MVKKKRAAKKKTTQREVLVVASKVKAYVKGKSMNTSADAIAALSNAVYEMIDCATTRTTNNGRKTLKSYDL